MISSDVKRPEPESSGNNDRRPLRIHRLLLLLALNPFRQHEILSPSLFLLFSISLLKIKVKFIFFHEFRIPFRRRHCFVVFHSFRLVVPLRVLQEPSSKIIVISFIVCFVHLFSASSSTLSSNILLLFSIVSQSKFNEK